MNNDRNSNNDRQTASSIDPVLATITGVYADAYRAWDRGQRADRPDPVALVKAHPEYAYEIVEFLLYFHTIAVDLPAPDPVPAAELSPAAKAAMERIRALQQQQGRPPHANTADKA